MIGLDFETEAIGPRPAQYPPKPVGLAWRKDDRTSGYIAWGHPTNNSPGNPRAQATKLLRDAFSGMHGTPMFHNGPFDIEVAMAHFGLGWPVDWGDSMFLAFLNNPRDPTLALKPLAAKYLGRKAEERDELKEWILANVTGATAKTWGAFIAKAPGDLVGRYAETDVEMTRGLAYKLGTNVVRRGMEPAYRRELALAPITMGMEQTGIRVNVHGLRKLENALARMLVDLDYGIIERLGGESALPDEFNLDSGAQLGAALVASGKIPPEKMIVTANGNQATSMDVLLATCADKRLVEVLALRSVVVKYLQGFVRPWLESAERTGGYVNPQFNQIRNRTEEGRGGGTRTGRYSSSNPNFQNIPSNVEESKNSAILKLLAIRLVAYGVIGFRGLRDYFLPDPGTWWVAADYNQQELRILAHFERGKLMAEYLRNPKLDVHAWVQDMVNTQTRSNYPRKFIKTVVFGLLYGMGAGKLATSLGITEEAAAKLRKGVLDALPGVKALMRNTKGQITTWGGRVYDVEERKILQGEKDHETDTYDDGGEYTFEYKQLNYLIQGSAADCTKQGMLNVRHAVPDARIAIQVHDELGVMVSSKAQVRKITDAMCDLAFTVPMIVEPKLTRTTWAQAA